MAGASGDRRHGSSRDRGRGGWRDGEGDRRGAPRGGAGPRRGDDGGYQLEEHNGVVKVWIGGLPHDVAEKELERLCAKIGELSGVSIRHSQRDTYAFVNFTRIGDAKKAIGELDQTSPFSTGKIKVAPAGRRTPKPEADPRARGEEDRSRPNDRARGARDHGRCARSDSRRKRTERRPSGRPTATSRSRSKPRPPWQRSPSPRQGRSRSPLQRLEEVWRVWVSYLPLDMEVDEFKDIVSEYGAVVGHGYETRQGSSYNTAWVEYRAKRQADAAVLELDERRIEGWSMRLKARASAGRGDDPHDSKR